MLDSTEFAEAKSARILLFVLLVVALAVAGAKADVIWTAYNDTRKVGGDGTAANATDWTIHNYDYFHNYGRLNNFATGSNDGMPWVEFTMGDGGLRVSNSSGGDPAPGTPAYEIFNNIVDFDGSIVYYGDPGWWVEIEFTGLDPTKTYTFVGTAIRDSYYSDRITLFTISGATDFTWNSSPGVGGSGATAVFQAGDNSTVNTGYVVRWDDIEPGDDSFKVRAEAAPGFDYKAYPFGGFMLQELGAPGNQPPVVGAGSDRQIRLPINSVNLDGAVQDDGLGEPNGFLEITWSKDSGPGVVTFEPNEFIEDPTARFSAAGEYVLKLSAWDGELDTNDVVTITVLEPKCPLVDLTDDCKIDYNDVKIMIEQWMTDPVHSGFGYPDLDGSDLVDMSDFTWLAGSWQENWQRSSLQVFIYPDKARGDGAQWCVDGGPMWYNHWDIVEDLSIGTHTVGFRTIADWNEPNDLHVDVVYGQIAEANGTYIEHTGSLQVNISPQDAIDDGAQWRRVDESTWRDSGVSGREDDVPVGPRGVEFSNASGWLKPGIKEVFVERNLLEVLDVNYTSMDDITLRINEFMATNSTGSGITDEHGDPDDWIEIYNSTDSPVDIGGMYISDEDVQDKWEIPTGYSQQTTIAANGYLLLWADNEQTEGPLHLPFQLNADGDEITLYDTDGATVIDSIAFGDQVTNVSYGRYPDGSDTWYYYKNPTDGNSNNQAGFADVVADTKFSPDRGFYNSAFYVTITTDTPGATIFYTTDCTWPIDQFGNPTATAQTYDEATNRPYIYTTTNLRAAAVKAGQIPTNVDTQTYIFLNDVLIQGNSGRPSGYESYSWGQNGPDYEVDPVIVGHSQSANRLTTDDMKVVPTIVVSMPKDDWFKSGYGLYVTQSLDGTEYPCSFEYFDPNGSGLNLQQNCAMAMQGGISDGGTSLNRWKTDKLSNRPRFKTQTDNGTPTGGLTKLRAKIFPDSPVEDFDSIVLDSVLNHSWLHSGEDQRDEAKYVQDQAVADYHNAMLPGHSPHGAYAHVYINNLYWGMYYIHERPDHSWAAETFGGEKEEYDAVKHGNDNVTGDDIINEGVGGAGAKANWDTMMSAASAAGSDPTNLTKWQTVEQHLDVDNLITYLLSHWFAGIHDWPGKNWYATHRVGGQWRFHTWDAEHSFEGHNNTDISPKGVHSYLKNHIEYKMKWADHIHKHFHHSGPLSYPRSNEIYQARVTQVNEAIRGESGRWGDNREDEDNHETYTRTDWLGWETQSGSYFTNRSTNVFGWLVGASLYPNTDLYPNKKAPEFEINGSLMYGGYVSYGDDLTITKIGSGTIWYTTNGDDPRSPGGAVNTPPAEQYTGTPISLTYSVRVKARVLNGSEWTALSDAVFAFEQPIVENLRITEIMYHPEDTGDPNDPNEEFIELMNIGPDAINLNLVRFTNGVDFTFPDIELEPNNFILVVNDPNAFEAQYGTGPNTAGVYSGRLDNGGERIELEDALGWPILNFRYRDGWYDVTDGGGFSLTHRDPCNIDPCDWGLESSWGASTYWGGSPGKADMGPKVGDIVINEILANSDTLPYDWVELYNTTDKTIDIGGWWLSDSGSEPNLIKYQIPENTTIGPDQYKVFTEAQFGDQNDPNCHVAFALSGNGETLYLSSGIPGELTLTGFRDERDFRASDPDVAFGLYTKSTLAALAGDPTDFVAMSQNSKDSANIYPPIVGPIVIAEIMYHPEDPNDPELEYIKLVNISDSNVTLQEYDPNEGVYVQWKFTDGIRYTFDPNTTIDASDYIYVVYDKTEFESAYPSVPSGKIFGPFEDKEGEVGNRTKLSNGGEDVELSKPGDKDETTSERFYILVDRVNYSDGTHPRDGYIDPWPEEPDGNGKALSRINLERFGNDPNNWDEADPAPDE